MRVFRNLTKVLILSSSISFVGAGVMAQDTFPDRPITITVGFAPGGSTDAIIRAMARSAERVLGQPITIVNRPGGGGSVALSNLLRESADGYELATLTTGSVTAQYTTSLPYVVTADFTPITEVVSMPAALVVRSDSPWTTLDEFVEHARENPGRVTYSSAGVGLSQHLAMERLALETGVTFVHAPYGGGMEAVTALVGGHVQATSQSPEWKPYVDDGTLRMLAVYGEERMAEYPEVMTLREQGYDFSMSAIIALVGPSGMSSDRVQILVDAFRGALDDPEFLAAAEAYYMIPSLMPSEEFSEKLHNLDEDMKALIEGIGGLDN